MALYHIGIHTGILLRSRGLLLIRMIRGPGRSVSLYIPQWYPCPGSLLPISTSSLTLRTVRPSLSNMLCSPKLTLIVILFYVPRPPGKQDTRGHIGPFPRHLPLHPHVLQVPQPPQGPSVEEAFNRGIIYIARFYKKVTDRHLMHDCRGSTATARLCQVQQHQRSRSIRLSLSYVPVLCVSLLPACALTASPCGVVY
jgi:hypothetical protein